MAQACSGGRIMSNEPWLNFDAKIGFGMQMGYWCALLAQEAG